MFALQAQTPINQSSLQDFWSSHEGEKPEPVTAPWQRPGRNIIWATGQVSCDINLETFIQSCVIPAFWGLSVSGPSHWGIHCMYWTSQDPIDRTNWSHTHINMHIHSNFNLKHIPIQHQCCHYLISQWTCCPLEVALWLWLLLGNRLHASIQSHTMVGGSNPPRSVYWFH